MLDKRRFRCTLSQRAARATTTIRGPIASERSAAMAEQTRNAVAQRAALITQLLRQEPEAITRTIAMMAYNPSIGRVLQRGGVDQFADLMLETVPKLFGLVTRE